jgi:uncharacterized membrane protein
MIGPVELIVAAFHSEGKAGEVLRQLRILEKDGDVFLVNAAVMSKDEQGQLSLSETQDVSSGKGAIFGAIAGGLIGWLGGPLGAVIGAAAGAATGGVAAGHIDMGFPDETLNELKDLLKPNDSAILALIQHQWVDRVIEELDRYGAILFRQALKEEISAQLSDEEGLAQ